MLNSVFVFGRIILQKVDRIRLAGVRLKERRCAMRVIKIVSATTWSPHYYCSIITNSLWNILSYKAKFDCTTRVFDVDICFRRRTSKE